MGLINYHELKRSVSQLNDQLAKVSEQRFKVGGSVIKMPENSVPREVIIIENMMKMDHITGTMVMHQYLVSIADEFISIMPEPFKGMMVDKFIKKLNVTELEVKYCYTNRQINRIINNLVDKYCEIM